MTVLHLANNDTLCNAICIMVHISLVPRLSLLRRTWEQGSIHISGHFTFLTMGILFQPESTVSFFLLLLFVFLFLLLLFSINTFLSHSSILFPFQILISDFVAN